MQPTHCPYAGKHTCELRLKARRRCSCSIGKPLIALGIGRVLGIRWRRSLAVTEEQFIHRKGKSKEYSNGNQPANTTGIRRVQLVIIIREALVFCRLLQFLQAQFRVIQLILQAAGTPEDVLVFRGLVALTAHYRFPKFVCNIQIGLTFPL